MFLTSIVIVIISCIIIYIRKIYKLYDYFKCRQIPGPTPRLFYGHFKEFWSTESYSKQLQTWTHQYGPIYGVFEGTKPMFVVSDINFLQEVYIEQFLLFHSRPLSTIMRIENDGKIHLFRATGSRWCRQRNVINSMFSKTNLNITTQLVNDCVNTMLTKLSNIATNKNVEIDIFNFYKQMTMDVICK